MDREIAYIIEHMAPVELAMLEDRNVILSPRLHERAEEWRRLEANRVLRIKRERLELEERKAAAAAADERRAAA